MNYKSNTTDCTKVKINQNEKSTCEHTPDLATHLTTHPIQRRCKKCGGAFFWEGDQDTPIGRGVKRMEQYIKDGLNHGAWDENFLNKNLEQVLLESILKKKESIQVERAEPMKKIIGGIGVTINCDDLKPVIGGIGVGADAAIYTKNYNQTKKVSGMKHINTLYEINGSNLHIKNLTIMVNPKKLTFEIAFRLGGKNNTVVGYNYIDKTSEYTSPKSLYLKLMWFWHIVLLRKTHVVLGVK